MKTNKNKKWGVITRIARSLGLIGKQGIYYTRDGRKIDLTATAETREAVIYTIGLQTLI